MSRNIKFNYRRLSPQDFMALLRRSTLSLTEFLYLSGRRREQIENYVNGEERGYTPTMGDALIMELAALDAANIDDMKDIAGKYSTGQSEKE